MRVAEFEPGIQAIFSEAEQAAYGAGRLTVGSAGSIVERSNAAGVRFLARVYVDASGRHREEYLGALDGADDARAGVEFARRQKSLVSVLKSAGYQVCDRKSFDTLVVMHNHGLFESGATLVGSHAWGALMNALGHRADPYLTLDVDIGRDEPLELGDGVGPLALAAMLAKTGIQLVPVPELDSRKPSTSFKERGASRFRIDLLAPSATDDYGVVAVPELDAHASTLPWFGYLLGDRVRRIVLGPRGAVPVFVPAPGRFALHKVLVSQMRTADASKAAKDLRQAGALLQALTVVDPDAIGDAAASVPVSARSRLRNGLGAIERFGLVQDATVKALLGRLTPSDPAPPRTAPSAPSSGSSPKRSAGSRRRG